MFGIGTSEFLVIILVAILVLGPEHLPRIVRTVTKVMSDVRRVTTDFQRTMNLEANKEEWEQQQTAKNTRKRKKRKAAPEQEVPQDPPGTAGEASAVADAKTDEQEKSSPDTTILLAKSTPDATFGLRTAQNNARADADVPGGNAHAVDNPAQDNGPPRDAYIPPSSTATPRDSGPSSREGGSA